MSTVGFLSLLGEDEIASMQRTLDTKKAENELPVYLRNSGAGSTLTASELFSAAVPTPREMDEFKRWLEEVLNATPRVIEREGKAPAAGAKLPPRLAVFLAFYRLGLPIRTIKAANIGAATAWTEQGRTAWPSAQWIEVPAIRAASGLNTTFSFAWWLSPKGGPLPSVGEMVRMPKVTVCHRFQTSVRESDPKAQAVRFRDDRKDLIDVFRGTTSESESVRAIKDQHSDWEADAVGAFMNKMKLEGAQVAEQEHGVSLLEGYLDTKRSLGWKRRWYVLTGGNGVTGMLRYARDLLQQPTALAHARVGVSRYNTRRRRCRYLSRDKRCNGLVAREWRDNDSCRRFSDRSIDRSIGRSVSQSVSGFLHRSIDRSMAVSLFV